MAALPTGTYEAVVLAAKPVRRGKLMYFVDLLLTKAGERVEASIFFGREASVMVANAKLAFAGYNMDPRLPPADRTVPLPVLEVTLEFVEKFPDTNRLIKAKRTSREMLCDTRHDSPRKDFIEF